MTPRSRRVDPVEAPAVHPESAKKPRKLHGQVRSRPRTGIAVKNLRSRVMDLKRPVNTDATWPLESPRGEKQAGPEPSRTAVRLARSKVLLRERRDRPARPVRRSAVAVPRAAPPTRRGAAERDAAAGLRTRADAGDRRTTDNRKSPSRPHARVRARAWRRRSAARRRGVRIDDRPCVPARGVPALRGEGCRSTTLRAAHRGRERRGVSLIGPCRLGSFAEPQ